MQELIAGRPISVRFEAMGHFNGPHKAQGLPHQRNHLDNPVTICNTIPIAVSSPYSLVREILPVLASCRGAAPAQALSVPKLKYPS